MLELMAETAWHQSDGKLVDSLYPIFATIKGHEDHGERTTELLTKWPWDTLELWNESASCVEYLLVQLKPSQHTGQLTGNSCRSSAPCVLIHEGVQHGDLNTNTAAYKGRRLAFKKAARQGKLHVNWSVLEMM